MVRGLARRADAAPTGGQAAHRRLARRLEKAQRGLLGDVAPVGEGVYELREFFGPGWRMYYVQRGSVVIVMLGGGDKSTQQADIAAAQALAATLEPEEGEKKE